MKRYIDADRLKAGIERRRLSNRYIDTEGYESELLALIDSLQQERTEGLHFTPLNRLIQKIPSENWNDTVNNYAKKLRDCLIKEGYRKDAEVLQGYISYMNGNNVPMATMDEKEQPQVADASKMERPVEGLEEAADAHIRRVADAAGHPGWDWTTQDIAEAFKAGAEWRAGQGISYDATISADKTIPVLPMKDVSNMGLDYGDNVTVQLWKK